MSSPSNNSPCDVPAPVATQACDRCRKTKRKCVYVDSAKSCTQCLKANAQCTMKYVPKRKAKQRQSDDVGLLHERVRQLEKALSAHTGLVVEEATENDYTHDDTTDFQSVPSSSVPGQIGPDVVDHDFISTLTSQDEEHALGDSQASDWINRLSVGSRVHAFVDPRLGNCDELPPAHLAWVLLQEYLRDFNQAYPLFAESFLTDLYRVVFFGQDAVESVQTAIVYITLSIAHRLRAMSPLATSADDERAKTFLECASRALPDILLNDPTLLSAQYFTGMAIVLEGTASPDLGSNFSANALRILPELLAYKKDMPEEAGEILQIQRVYWVALMIEADLSIRRGRWSSPHFPVAEIDLAPEHPADALGTLGLGRHSFPILRRRGQLSQIQTHIWFALTKRPTSPQELQSLAQELVAWRVQEPMFNVPPEAFMRNIHRSDSMHLLILEASYFNTFFVLQSFEDGIGPFDISPLFHLHRFNNVVLGKYGVQARRLLEMFNALPQGDFAAVWLVVEAVALAVFVALKLIIRDPTASTAQKDKALMPGPLHVIGELGHRYGQMSLMVALRTIDPLAKAAEIWRDNNHNVE